jgi:anti-sigma regulatory factor (Ser/Thr protein kinase)
MTAHWGAAQAKSGSMRPEFASLLADAIPRKATGQGRRPAPPDQQFDATAALAAQPQSVKIARDFTRTTLRAWGMSALADDALLVVSELVTNALQHATPGAIPLHGGNRAVIWLRLMAEPPYLMCMVTDPGREIPLRRQAGPGEVDGRGLHVIESCSSRWGWHLLDDGGKLVWVLLPRG